MLANKTYENICTISLLCCSTIVNDGCICGIMGQNQSHVAKHETAQICILSENVKI